MQVLRNWYSLLRPGGIIAGVVPDCRFTFDYRIPVSSVEEIGQELTGGSHAVPAERYDRWSKGVGSGRTGEMLMQEDYIIPVHYYTPELFRDVCHAAFQNMSLALTIEEIENNKDFSFVIQPSAKNAVPRRSKRASRRR